MDAREAYGKFQLLLGADFLAWDVFEQCLRHSSASNEGARPKNNERFAFLGDALIDLVASEVVYEHNDKQGGPRGSTAPLTDDRKELVSNAALAGIGADLGLSSTFWSKRARERAVATMVEAVVGAVCRSRGHEAALVVARKLLDPAIKRKFRAFTSTS